MQQTPAAIRSLRILYFGLLAGMLMMSGVIFFVSTETAPVVENIEAAKNFFLLVLMIAAVCVSISSALMRRDLKKINDLSTVSDRFNFYRRSAIRTYALHEAPALFAIISYFLTHQPQLFFVVGLIIIGYLREYPSARQVAARIQVAPDALDNL